MQTGMSLQIVVQIQCDISIFNSIIEKRRITTMKFICQNTVKFAVVLCILLQSSIFVIQLNAQELGTFEYNKHNELLDFWSEEVGGFGLADNDRCFLAIEDAIYTVGYLMAENELTQFRNVIDKYLQWEALATKNKDELKKDITTIKFPVAILKSNYSDSGHGGYNPKITFMFFSQNPQRHQLLLKFSKVEADDNQFISKKPSTAYIEKDQVEKMKQILSEENIAKKQQEAIEQRKIEEKYN